MLKRIRHFASKLGQVFNDVDPLMIQMYGSYASRERFFIQGRVYENENIFLQEDQHKIRTLIENFKRFETDEIRGAKVGIRVMDKDYEVITDEEGYFTLDERWEAPIEPIENRWIPVELYLKAVPEEVADKDAYSEGALFIPSQNADVGIISDIDDTVLRTYATSRFRLKMIYASFFQDPYERLPMEGVGEVYKQLEKGADGKKENPVFYVSNSPWNIYDNITTFLEFNHFPGGPVLLRDIGLHTFRKKSPEETHKIKTIRHIMNMYPEMSFVMLGDTAAEDADFYLQLAEEFPGRVKTIYIRITRSTKNSRRIEALVEQNSATEVVLVHSSEEILDHLSNA
jgi:phosphatidate phosphatase APP1